MKLSCFHIYKFTSAYAVNPNIPYSRLFIVVSIVNGLCSIVCVESPTMDEIQVQVFISGGISPH